MSLHGDLRRATEAMRHVVAPILLSDFATLENVEGSNADLFEATDWVGTTSRGERIGISARVQWKRVHAFECFTLRLGRAAADSREPTALATALRTFGNRHIVIHAWLSATDRPLKIARVHAATLLAHLRECPGWRDKADAGRLGGWCGFDRAHEGGNRFAVVGWGHVHPIRIWRAP